MDILLFHLPQHFPKNLFLRPRYHSEQLTLEFMKTKYIWENVKMTYKISESKFISFPYFVWKQMLSSRVYQVSICCCCFFNGGQIREVFLKITWSTGFTPRTACKYQFVRRCGQNVALTSSSASSWKCLCSFPF